MWKATIRIGKLKIPVKLYAAVQERRVHFRLLHADDQVPVKQRMVRPSTGEAVPPESIVKGVEIERGVFVVLEDEELEELAPAPSREIEVLRFVERGSVAAQWYRRPYFLGPDGDPGDYAALVVALQQRDVEGIARFVMRGTRYVAALLAHGRALALVTLRHAQEVVTLPKLSPPPELEANKKEVELAKQLVKTLEGSFDPSELTDQYRDRLHELVQAKARGETVKARRFVPRKTAPSLADALRESVALAKEAHVA